MRILRVNFLANQRSIYPASMPITLAIYLHVLLIPFLPHVPLLVSCAFWNRQEYR
jgi:hypothetical protein